MIKPFPFRALRRPAAQFPSPQVGHNSGPVEIPPRVETGPPPKDPPDLTGERAEEYAAWAALVERIRSGDDAGMAELYRLFSKGIRFYLCRHLGAQDLDDRVHDTFLMVVQAIQRGDLREPERLMGFVRTVVRRQVAAHIDRAVQTRRDLAEYEPTLRVLDPRDNPEDAAIFRQRIELIRRVLSELSERDREG